MLSALKGLTTAIVVKAAGLELKQAAAASKTGDAAVSIYTYIMNRPGEERLT